MTPINYGPVKIAGFSTPTALGPGRGCFVPFFDEHGKLLWF
jgi:hypothetical protein